MTEVQEPIRLWTPLGNTTHGISNGGTTISSGWEPLQVMTHVSVMC